MSLDNWSSQACPRPSCSFYGQKGKDNIHPRGWIGRRRDIRLLWCCGCGQRFSERLGTPFYRTKLKQQKVVDVVEHLTEGCGIRPTARLCHVHVNTVMRLLRSAGHQAIRFHDERVRNLTIAGIQLDEKRCVFQGRQLLPPEPRGDPETWREPCHRDGTPRLYLRRRACWDHVCIASMEKLVISVRFGPSRTKTGELLKDVAMRINGGQPPALVESDEWAPIVREVSELWCDSRLQPGEPADFVHGVVHKVRQNHRVVKCIRRIQVGDRKLLKALRRRNPSLPRRLNTSFVERYHRTDRHMVAYKRRLGLCIPRSGHHYAAASWLAIVAYNFTRTHRSLRSSTTGLHKTPAQAAGVTNHQWTWREVLSTPVWPPQCRKAGRTSAAQKFQKSRKPGVLVEVGDPSGKKKPELVRMPRALLAQVHPRTIARLSYLLGHRSLRYTVQYVRSLLLEE